MDILPARTQPYRHRIRRQHKPREASWRGGYREFQACLRWEFGFTCAMCLLHEGDLLDAGLRSTGLTTAEHIQPQSRSPEEANAYSNCLYVCRYCNNARSDLPQVSAEGQRLLNPTTSKWADHFVVEGDRLAPRPGDADAAYTHRAYRLDEPKKVWMRRERRERIEACLELVREGPRQLRFLLEMAAKLERGAGPEGLLEAERLKRSAELHRTSIERAFRELSRYRAVPEDHDLVCRCSSPPPLRIPVALREQLVQLSAPPEVQEPA